MLEMMSGCHEQFFFSTALLGTPLVKYKFILQHTQKKKKERKEKKKEAKTQKG